MAVQTEPASKNATVNGVRLHYLDWGNEGAQPLLLLHGFTGHARSWDAFARSVAGAFHVYALDQRGHGDSAWTDEYGTQAMVDDVDAFTRQLGLERFVLLGLSMGGRNAINYAGTHPEEVDRLVIVDIGPEIDASGAARIQTGVRANDVFDSREEAFEQARRGNTVPPEEHHRYRINHNLMQTADGKWTWKYDKALRSGTPRPSIDNDQQWANWRAIRCPILLLRGENSDVLAPAVAERMARENANTKLVTIAGSGHSIPLDKPEAFEAAVREWLGA
ncbi:MAG TPA: alpha/beta hydrolase [Dehalococcoidia bacterium]